MRETPEQDLILRAGRTASQLHEGQMYGDAPYIMHVRTVGMVLAAGGFSPEMVAAGFLHDTVEDTSATVASIEAEFGPTVASIVAAMTKTEGVDYFDYIAALEGDAVVVKLADVLCNYVAGLDPVTEAIVDPRSGKYARAIFMLVDKLERETVQAILGSEVDMDLWLAEVAHNLSRWTEGAA